MNIEFLKNRIEEVIKTDATITGAADFLATHVPFKNLKYVNSGVLLDNPNFISEENFFKNYVMERYNYHNFLVVQGDSGSGKSHFIRWLKNRYENEVDKNKEAMLLIIRSKNTLKGALKQIIESNIFNDVNRTRELQRLVEADQNLSPEKLNSSIIMQFAVEVQSDTDPDSVLEAKYKSWLYYFLVDPIVQKELLLKKNGPIERIKAKLASEDNDVTQGEFEAKFEPEDFYFTFSDPLLKLMKDSENRASEQAIKCAERLIHERRGSEFREKVAAYMNEKIATVIQSCIKLRAQDLQEIIENLRIELKNQDKSLTLFVEDITSFTGIDRGLVESLIVEHDSDPKLCRLFSIIGVTTSYYNSFFPDNMKARVTGRVIVSNEALFKDSKDILELSARYINAINLDKSILEDWMKKGADESKLPTASENLKYNWSLHKADNDCEMSLFPFNANSLIGMYSTLQEQTPRMFIKEVIKAVLLKYLNDPKNFPPEEKELEGYFKVPSWKETKYEQLVMLQGKSEASRISTVLRLWGDRTADKRLINNEEILGGLTKKVFDVFNLTFIDGVRVSSASANTTVSTEGLNKGRGTELVIDISKTGDKKVKSPTSSGVNDIPLPVTVPVVSPPASNPAKDEFNKAYEELNKWMNAKEALKSHKRFRLDVSDFLISAIDWEFEGVSPLLAHAYINLTNIGIEGQTVSEKNDMLFKRENKFYYALISLAAWRNLGDRTWNFENSLHYLTNLTNWFLSVKAEVIEFVKGIKHISEKQMIKIGVANEYFTNVIMGNLRENHDIEDVYKVIINKEIKLNQQYSNSEDWNKLKQNINEKSIEINKNHQFITRFYNSTLGDVNPEATPSFFLDAAQILMAIKELSEEDWDIKKLNIPLDVDDSEKWFVTAGVAKKLFEKTLPVVIKSEITTVKKAHEKIKGYVGDLEDSGNLDLIFAHMIKFLEHILTEAKEPYSKEQFAPLLNQQLNSTLLHSISQKLKDVLNKNENDILIHFSLYPSKHIDEYVKLFEAMELLVNTKEDKYKKQYASMSVRVKDFDKLKAEIRDTLTNLKAQYLSLGGGDTNAAR